MNESPKEGRSGKERRIRKGLLTDRQVLGADLRGVSPGQTPQEGAEGGQEPVFVPKPVEKSDITAAMEKSEKERRGEYDNGFDSETNLEIVRVCKDAFYRKFPTPDRARPMIDGAVAHWGVETIEKISESEARVVIKGGQSVIAHQPWEARVVEKDGRWVMERAREM